MQGRPREAGAEPGGAATSQGCLGPWELEGAGTTLPWSLPRLLTALLGHEAGSEAGPVDCVTVSPCDFPGKLCLWRGRTALVLKT